MIALQVAAGILLAYIIIVNQRFALKAGKVLGAILLFIVLALIAFYLIGIAWEALSKSVGPAVSPTMAKLTSKIGSIVVVLFLFVCAAIGGHCLSMVRYKLRGIEPPADERENSLVLWSILNVTITVGVLGLLSLTPFDIAGDVDSWSRNRGYKDAGSVILLAVLLPWPAIWFWILSKRRTETQTVESTSEDL